MVRTLGYDMGRGTVRASLTAVLLLYGASVSSAQQATPDAGAPIFSLDEIIATALESGAAAVQADRTLEQARLSYRQARAQTGPTLGLTGSLSHGDGYDLSPGAAADTSALGSNHATASLALKLPATSLTLSAGHSLTEAPGSDPVNVTTLSLEAGQTLWDGEGVGGGRTRLETEKSGLALEGQTLADGKTRKEIVLAVTRGYHALLAAQRALDLRAADRVQKTAEADRAALLLESGRASELEVAQAQINLRAAALEERVAGAALQSARAQLSAQLGWERGRVYEVEEAQSPQVPVVDPQEAVASALAAREDLAQLRLDRRSGEIDLRLARAQASPQLSVSGSAGMSRNWTQDATEVDWSARLAVSLPILDSGATRTRVQSQSLANATLDTRIAEMEAAIGVEVLESIDALQTAAERVELARMRADQAGLSMELATLREEMGDGTLLDVLTASSALSTARAALLDAENDLQIAVLEYRRAIGA